MFRLIKLEQRQIKLTPYLIASVVVAVVMFYGIITSIDMDLAEKATKQTIIPTIDKTSSFIGTISVLCFSIMGTVIFSRLVIMEYSDKKPVLLFSYPVSRVKVFLAKLLLAGGFTLAAALVISFLAGLFLMFFEPVASKLLYDFGAGELGRHMLISFTASLLAVTLATAGLLVGFLMKSVPATIITAVALVLFTSSSVNGLLEGGSLVLVALTVLSLLLIAAVAGLLAIRIRKLEI